MDNNVLIFDLEQLYNAEEYIPPTGNCLAIPREFKNRMEELTHRKNESAGIIVCSHSVNNKSINYLAECVIELNTGGSPFHTGDFDTEKVEKVNEVLRKCTGVSVLYYHCHTVETGEHWWDKFSKGDYNTFKQFVNEIYIHILFTPKNILTYSNCGLIEVRFTTQKSKEMKLKVEMWRKLFKGIKL